MYTLNQLIKKIQTLKEAHGQLNNGTFYFGDEWEYEQTTQYTFPFTGVRLLGSSIDGNLHTTNLNLFFADRVKSGELNETEVLSDCGIYALDIYSQLKLNLESNDPTTTPPATLQLSSQITPFTEGFLSATAGMEMNISIIQFYDRQTCDIPT